MIANRCTPLLLLCLLLSLLTACGWQLRGAHEMSLPDHLRNLHISGDSSALLNTLRQSVQDSDVQLVDSPARADLTLRILSERAQQRTATISASARVSEYLLSHTVEYVILDSDGEPIFPPGRLDVERVYEYNEENILATDDENLLLQGEMRQELVRQLQVRLTQAASRLAGPHATTP